MDYDRELNFVCNVLDKFKVRHRLIYLDTQEQVLNEMDIRISLGLEGQRDFLTLLKSMDERSVYRWRDVFSCRYFTMFLPDTDRPRVFIIGPYITGSTNREWLENFVKKNQLDEAWATALEYHLSGVPCLPNEDPLLAAVNVLGEYMWGGAGSFTVRIMEGNASGLYEALKSVDMEPRLPEHLAANIRRIEEYYEAERVMLQAVSQGRANEARLALMEIYRMTFEERTIEPDRNIKNHLLMFNALMRKSAEIGRVHPIYLDRLCSRYAEKIERETFNGEDVMNLTHEMVREYCRKVQERAVHEFTELVREVVLLVDFDLSGDLSLKSCAAALNVNASYLSTLFKREMGMTLTEYVNRKRVEQAAFLLQATNMTISSVGKRCGIQDDAYFTKLFKKFTGSTPKQFRQTTRPVSPVKPI